MPGLDLAWVILSICGAMLLIPAAVLLAEALASLLPEKPRASEAGPRPRIAVLVPAHDESLMIAGTVRAIRSGLAPGDGLLVVADNCSDATADIAASFGAEVVQRADAQRRGKSFALGFGVRHLALDPPDVVIVIDADCTPEAGALEVIGKRAFETGRPVQALYELLMPDAADPSPGFAIADFAFKFKNQLRPRGLARLGLPCQLMGTGMAFPWRALEAVDLENGELAEDLVLGLDLARSGFPPLFAPDARVTSPHPASREGRLTQRERWETGHLSTIWRRVPRLLLDAVWKRNLSLLALALDVAVPPLAFHVLLLVGLLAIGLPFALLTGHPAPFLIAASALAMLGAAVLLGWRSVGKDNLRFAELARVPAYIISKVPLYSQILKGKSISWVRSKRD